MKVDINVPAIVWVDDYHEIDILQTDVLNRLSPKLKIVEIDPENYGFDIPPRQEAD